MQDHDLLRQVVRRGEFGQPLGGLVDLIRGDRADLLHVHLSRGQTPFGIQRQANIGPLQEFRIAFGLSQEIGVARLQIEHHVHAVLLGGLDVGDEVIHGDLVGVVAVRSGLRGRRRDNDLEGGDDLFLAVRLVLLGQFDGALRRGFRSLFAQCAQPGCSGVPVERDEAPIGEQLGSAADQLGWLRGRGCRLGRCRRRGGSVLRSHRLVLRFGFARAATGEQKGRTGGGGDNGGQSAHGANTSGG